METKKKEEKKIRKRVKLASLWGSRFPKHHP